MSQQIRAPPPPPFAYAPLEGEEVGTATADASSRSSRKHWVSEEDIDKFRYPLETCSVVSYVEIYQRQRYDPTIHNWRASPKQSCPFFSDAEGYFPLYSLCSQPYTHEDADTAWKSSTSFVPFRGDNPLHAEGEELEVCWHTHLEQIAECTGTSSTSREVTLLSYEDDQSTGSDVEKVHTKANQSVKANMPVKLHCKRTHTDVQPPFSPSVAQLVAAEMAIAGGLSVPDSKTSLYRNKNEGVYKQGHPEFVVSEDDVGWVWAPTSEWQVQIPDGCSPPREKEKDGSNLKTQQRIKWEYEKLALSGGWEYAKDWDEPFTFRYRPPSISTIGVGEFSKALGGEQVRRRKWIRKVIATPKKMRQLFCCGFLMPSDKMQTPLQLRFPVPSVKLHVSHQLAFLLHGVGHHGKEKMGKKRTQVARMYSALYEAAESSSISSRMARIDVQGISWHATKAKESTDSGARAVSPRTIGANMEGDEDSDSSDSEMDVQSPQTPLQLQRNLSGMNFDSAGQVESFRTSSELEMLPNDLPDHTEDCTQRRLHQVSSLLATVKLSTLPRLRTFISTTMVNGANYFGPFGDCIRAHVAKQLNLYYKQYIVSHACSMFQEDLQVCILGHSLGGVIAFDLLSSKSQRLCFTPSCLFAMGSPIAMYLTTRGLLPEDIYKKYKIIRDAGVRFFNLYHDCDPIAMRFAPLISSPDTDCLNNAERRIVSPLPFSIVDPQSPDGKYFLDMALHWSSDRIARVIREKIVGENFSRQMIQEVAVIPEPPRRSSSQRESGMVSPQQAMHSPAKILNPLEHYFKGVSRCEDPFTQVEEEASAMMEEWKQGERVDFQIPRGSNRLNKLDYIAARNAHRAYWSSPGLVAFVLTVSTFVRGDPSS